MSDLGSAGCSSRRSFGGNTRVEAAERFAQTIE